MPNTIHRYSLTLLLSAGLLLSGYSHGVNVHPKCTDCHVAVEPTEKSAELIRPGDALCTECHPSAEGFTQHAIGVAPEGGKAGGLPLVDGKIACITCHDSHITTRGLLRINSEALCRACHDQ